MQAAKIIDVSRSFIPVDPNSFPENYHSTQKEDSPEDRPPVVPYMGYNFLPTAEGYKSFFGTNFKAGIDALSGQAEYVFLFQNMAYANTLIALCDNGVWAKDANTAGAWTQLVVLAAPAEGIYYEWFAEIIKNKLYVFRGNGEAYYVLETDISSPVGVDVTTVVPSFITINAQLGMFRLGGRLGFWDGENAICWSSPDDLEDFTPDAITGANVTKFNSITGKISAIRAHGTNAIVYASKSITFLDIQAANAFLVKATPLIQAGVPYNRQSVVAYPSDIHYVYASTGIYKIENGKAEVVVPEVFDFFKKQTNKPIYLRYLQGRYLAFECMDAGVIDGIPHFSNVYYPPASITFPAVGSLTGIEPTEVDWCSVLNGINNAAFDDMQPSSMDIPDKMPGSKATPIWTCYLSNNGIKDVSNLTFESNPCGTTDIAGTTEWPMTPVGAITVDKLTTDSSEKRAVTGEEAYIDGKWTMERFLQAQTAIWKMEEDALQDTLNTILSQAYFDTLHTENSNSCVATPNPVPSYCELGEFVSAFSAPQFGYNTCSFWLTRFAIESKEIAAKTSDVITCTDIGTTDTAVAPARYELWASGTKWTDDGAISGNFASIDEAVAVRSARISVPLYVNYGANPPSPQGAGGGAETSTNGVAQLRHISNDAIDLELKAIYVNPDPVARSLVHIDYLTYETGWPNIVSQYKTGYSTITRNKSCSNVVQETNSGVIGVETAYCEITGWEYTKTDGTIGTAAASCNLTDNLYKGSTPSPYRTVTLGDNQPDLLQGDGSICDIPFVSPITPEGIIWEEQTITYPAFDFLFQDGSIAPRWPTMYGAYVYDTHLKKWGKFKGEYKQLLDYFPVNSDSASPLATLNQGMMAGVLKDDGFIYLFDNAPTESELTWGKIGYYRAGLTDAQEVTFNFVEPATGSVRVDLSLDGKTLIEEASYSVEHTDKRQVTVYPPYTGKWYNVTITGKYNISDLLFKGHVKGRR